MTLPVHSGRRLLSLASLGCFTLASLSLVTLAPGCYTAGDGTTPPGDTFYFPVGLAVSKGGNVLYAANSDFDLQWNGGTLQAYDLGKIRRDTLRIITNPFDQDLANAGAFVRTPPTTGPGDPNVPLADWCASGQHPAPSRSDGSGERQPLGETCAPPMRSQSYIKDSVIIGAFATDLHLSQDGKRVFVPVRGDGTVTWASVTDEATGRLECGARINNRCAEDHMIGNQTNEPGNTRGLTMPGEPFGVAETEDGRYLAITHQNDTKTSLFSAGSETDRTDPALQFVVDQIPIGGNGIVSVPYDTDLDLDCDNSSPDPARRCIKPRPAFLQTSRAFAELSLLRVYQDEGLNEASSLLRPFLVREAGFRVSANASGTDSRGIVIDTSPRDACKKGIPETAKEQRAACARRPARVFIANRSPSSLLIGELGGSTIGGEYDPDRLALYGSIPLTFGPSRLYLAPIVDKQGNYALRLFIVCFDSAAIFVYDPEANALENIIRVAPGPFAMAFDPFVAKDVAEHAAVGSEPVNPPIGKFDSLSKYKFAYVASFTKSHVQVIDLENRNGNPTFERVVFTLGQPTLPKGSN